jgi:hypothetical protein
VWTVNAKDVEWIQCEHVNKPGYIVQLEAQIKDLEKVHDKHQNKIRLEQLKERLSKERNSQKLNLEPENFSPEVTVKHFCTSFKKDPFQCKMNQIPANSNDGTTGHKLQGMSKDVIIVSSWPTGGLSKKFENWEYVVLSRVRTLSGLYLVDPIDMEILFNQSSQLKSYIDKIKEKKKIYLMNAKKLSCHKYHGNRQIVYGKKWLTMNHLVHQPPCKKNLKNIYQHLNHHVCRNQYST